MQSLRVGFLIFPGVVQLDALGAYQVLSFPPGAQIDLLWKDLNPIQSNEGLRLTPTQTFANCSELDILCVPGGGMGQVAVSQDSDVITFLQQQGARAKYITSVCTGSLILATAGLLQGYKATCHWAFRDQLALLGVELVPERVVVDRNRVTGAGVTSGIDLGLTLLNLIYGEQMAKIAQLMLEYDPQPPFTAAAGSPETADPTIRQTLLEKGQPLIAAFLAQTQKTQAANQP
jgi:cyclohexyl-isocyanide hydratase